MKYVIDRYKNGPYAVFVVPEFGNFGALVETKGKNNIGERINKTLSRLTEENELKGAINLVDFGDSTKTWKVEVKVGRLTKQIAIIESTENNF